MLNEFPNLETISTSLENDISRIDAAIRDVKTSERYADSTSERQYQLDKLAVERVETLADAETEYQLELELTERELADRAFEPVEISDDARAMVQAVTTSVTTSVNPVDTLSLLNVKARNMSDDEKTLLSLELAMIADAAHAKAIGDEAKTDVSGYINEIEITIADTEQSRNVSEQLEALQAIKRGAESVRRTIDSRDAALRRR